MNIDPLVCPNGHHNIDVGRDRCYCETCKKPFAKAELRNLQEETKA